MEGTFPSRASHGAAPGTECYDGRCEVSDILHIGIDRAKNPRTYSRSIWSTSDEHGKAVLVPPSVPRARLHQLMAALPLCTVGMEACSGAHQWARLFAQHGHTVRLMTQVRGATPDERQARQERRGRRDGDLQSGAAPEMDSH